MSYAEEEAAEEVMNEALKGFGMSSGLTATEDGGLELTGKLGAAVASGDLDEFLKAMTTGVTPDFENPITYQDMSDFSEFRRTYLLCGVIDGHSLLRRVDGATLARRLDSGDDRYIFSPAQVTVQTL